MKPGPRPRPLAFCLCGCARRVKSHARRYYSQACVPATIRTEGAKKGRKNFAMRRRAVLFRDQLRRLDRKVTREDLLSIFMDIYRLAYARGHRAAAWTYRYGPERRKAAA